jgi:hypothetical protein
VPAPHHPVHCPLGKCQLQITYAQTPCSVKKYNEVCAKAVAQQCNCKKECIEDQLNNSFTDEQKNKHVKHWQSDSKGGMPKELSDKLDNLYKAPDVGASNLP